MEDILTVEYIFQTFILLIYFDIAVGTMMSDLVRRKKGKYSNTV